MTSTPPILDKTSSAASPARTIGEDTQLFRQYLRRYWRSFSAGLGILIVVDLLEVLPPLILMHAIDWAVMTWKGEGSPRFSLAFLVTAYIVVTIFQCFGRYGWRMFLIRSSLFSARDLRSKFAQKLFASPISFYDRRSVGELMTLATSDVEAVRMAIGPGLLTLADASFYIITVPFAMYMLSPSLTFYTCLPLLLIPWVVVRNQREVHRRFSAVQSRFSDVSSLASEGLNGARVIKGFARESTLVGRFDRLGESLRDLNLRLSRVQVSFGPSLDFIMSLGLILLIWFGGKAVLAGTVTVGTFVAFQRYIQKMVWPMTAVGLAASYYQRGVASSWRMRDVIDEAPEADGTFAGSANKNSRGSPLIECRALTFFYPGASVASLKEVSLTIQRGERVALLGAVGAGKSTLLSLLAGLYPVERGQLWVEGVDINDWSKEALRRRIGVVAQDVFLFSESVEDNLAHAVSNPTRQRLENAAQMAHVHEEILALPEGYGTRLGERGLSLSGGQRQRLTLARALVSDPDLLLLDDPLSAVDVQTEEKILDALDHRQHQVPVTVLLSAHRVSTAQRMNRMVVLDQGRVVQSGSHIELMRDRNGPYRQFVEQQRVAEELGRYLDTAEAKP